MIDVNMGLQGGGATFRLAPGAIDSIRCRYSGIEPPGSVYVSYETRHDFEREHGSFWGQLAAILTGLTEQQLQELGGARFVGMPDGKEFARYPSALARR